MSSGGCFYTSRTAEGARKGGDTQRQPAETHREEERQDKSEEYLKCSGKTERDISKRSAVPVNVNHAGKVVV